VGVCCCDPSIVVPLSVVLETISVEVKGHCSRNDRTPGPEEMTRITVPYPPPVPEPLPVIITRFNSARGGRRARTDPLTFLWLLFFPLKLKDAVRKPNNTNGAEPNCYRTQDKAREYVVTRPQYFWASSSSTSTTLDLQ